MVSGQIANSYRPQSRLELLSTWKALDIAEVRNNSDYGDSPTPIKYSSIACVLMVQVDHQRISSHFLELKELLNG
jgi:hypothetical protein